MKLSQFTVAFLMGFFIYSLIEIVCRGFTHWTMSLTGGFVLALLYAVNSRRTITLIRSCFAGSLIITALEFAVGVFDNLIMDWNVWDYSDMPLNLLGRMPSFGTVVCTVHLTILPLPFIRSRFSSSHSMKILTPHSTIN